jgi:hypothetical protein
MIQLTNTTMEKGSNTKLVLIKINEIRKNWNNTNLTKKLNTKIEEP